MQYIECNFLRSDSTIKKVLGENKNKELNYLPVKKQKRQAIDGRGRETWQSAFLLMNKGTSTGQPVMDSGAQT